MKVTMKALMNAMNADPASLRRHFEQVVEASEARLACPGMDESTLRMSRRDLETANLKLAALSRGETVSL